MNLGGSVAYAPRTLRPDHVIAAVRLLSTLAEGPCTLQELQHATNLPGATIRRLLHDLPEAGFPVDSPPRKRRSKQLYALTKSEPVLLPPGSKRRLKRQRSRSLSALQDGLLAGCENTALDVIEFVVRKGQDRRAAFLLKLPLDTLAGLRDALLPEDAPGARDAAARTQAAAMLTQEAIAFARQLRADRDEFHEHSTRLDQLLEERRQQLLERERLLDEREQRLLKQVNRLEPLMPIVDTISEIIRIGQSLSPSSKAEAQERLAKLIENMAKEVERRGRQN